MLASYVNGHGNARIANLLLECGADPAQGIPLTLYRLMSRLKRTVVPKRDQLLSMRTMSSRLNSTGNSANGTPTLSRSTTPSKSPQPIAKADIRPPSRTTMGRSSFISMVAKAEVCLTICAKKKKKKKKRNINLLEFAVARPGRGRQVGHLPTGSRCCRGQPRHCVAAALKNDAR